MTGRLCFAFVMAALGVQGHCVAAPANERPWVNATAGLTAPDEPIRFAMLEIRSRVSPHVAVASTLAYLDGSAGYHELQLRLAAILAADLGRWMIDNRHMVSFSTESTERYRNRLRFIRPGLLGNDEISFRAFDEVVVDLDRGRWMRNSVAVGFGAQVHEVLTAELYHVWVDNRGTANDGYILALLTWRL